MAESEKASGGLKKGTLIGRAGQPLEFHDVQDSDLSESEIAGVSFPTATAKTLAAYLEASQTLCHRWGREMS